MSNVDRTTRQQIGLTQRDVANSMLISLSSSGAGRAEYWLNPQNGVNYRSRCRRRSTGSTPSTRC